MPVMPVRSPKRDDQARTVGARASFDGSRSKDPDGDALSYRWELLSRPAGSRAELGAAETVRPDLTIDAPGRYVAGLVVSDGRLSSVEDTVVVTTPNQAPLANAGPDATVSLRERAPLSGAASSDPDGDPLTYRWMLASRPAGSRARVFPAGAGMNRTGAAMIRREDSVPRRRGDEPPGKPGAVGRVMCSPQARG